MPRTSMLLASVAILAVPLSAPASAQLLQHKDVSLPVALAIANGALDACKAMGYAASVVVVDRDGDTIVALRGDGAGPHTVENARRKAYTANTFRMTTEAFLQEMKTRPVRREQTTLPHVIAINGGVPIKAGNEVIGGVGLSGSPGKDEECVNAGLEKVKQQLQ
ncbi:MAG TPA: heme-binding protein [Xanthobacteraceae bacterium]